MSEPPPLSLLQGERRKRTGDRRGSSGGDGLVKVSLHAVTDAQAKLLRRNTLLLREIRQKSDADIKFDRNPSPLPGMKIVIIHGAPSKIAEAVRLIHQTTGAQATLSDVEIFWLQWVEAAFPDLNSRAYFLPPVYFNRVPMTRQIVAGKDVQVLLPEKGGMDRFGQICGSSNQQELNYAGLNSNHQVTRPPVTSQASTSPNASVQDSDIRYDAAMRQVLFCLQNLSEKTGEVFVGITRFHFGQYLTEPGFAVVAAQLPRASNLPPHLPKNWKQGEFDVLLIHRYYGFVVCNVMSFGDITNQLCMSQDDIDETIRRKLTDAMSQLDKAEAMLSHLVSDIAPGLRITKTIALPNLTARQLQQAISHDSQLTEDLCRCLGTSDPADIPGLFCRLPLHVILSLADPRSLKAF
ncbi:uncharacterized protein LOC112574721 [Pomacea canaliculata]|uniref:uncharacterized protein LOC112574721 n=1 Tax=Pomacea canaliculata TaxID=400727 RepID=UPI000D73F158|nr:uncharacterized protein LOC112574721 [Pomacea canaliculata]